MFIDQNHILCITEDDKKIRQYEQILDGYKIQDFDKKLFVYHKKQIKELNFKELGNNMSIFFIKENSDIQDKINPNSFQNALNLFIGFDEDNRQQYAFLPKFSPSELNSTNEKLQKLGLNIKLENTDKGIIVDNFTKTESTDFMSALFALTMFYGKFDIKNSDLKSVKIHIPLFGQYINNKTELDENINTLQQKGIFCNTKEQATNDGIIYEIIISDYEVLSSFVNFLKPIAKIDQISKHKYALEATEKLLDHNSKVKELIEGKTIKLLTK